MSRSRYISDLLLRSHRVQLKFPATSPTEPSGEEARDARSKLFPAKCNSLPPNSTNADLWYGERQFFKERPNIDIVFVEKKNPGRLLNAVMIKGR